MQKGAAKRLQPKAPLSWIVYTLTSDSQKE